MKTHQNNKFDCMKVKRDSQATIYEAIKLMTPEEEIAYFRQSVEQSSLSGWWDAVPSRTEIPQTG